MLKLLFIIGLFYSILLLIVPGIHCFNNDDALQNWNIDGKSQNSLSSNEVNLPSSTISVDIIVPQLSPSGSANVKSARSTTRTHPSEQRQQDTTAVQSKDGIGIDELDIKSLLQVEGDSVTQPQVLNDGNGQRVIKQHFTLEEQGTGVPPLPNVLDPAHPISRPLSSTSRSNNENVATSSDIETTMSKPATPMVVSPEEDQVEDPFKTIAINGNDEVLRMLGILRPRPEVSQKALQYFQDVHGSEALRYALHHPEGPEYHEIQFNIKHNTSYVETNVVSLPKEFPSEDKGDICRFDLNIDSPILKLSPLVLIVVSSILKLAILSVDSDIPLKDSVDPFLPIFSLTAQGNCEKAMSGILAVSRLVGDYSLYSFYGDEYTNEERKAISTVFDRQARRMIQNARKSSTLDVSSIYDELLQIMSRVPYFTSDYFVQAEEEIPKADVLRFAELGREFLSESLSNTHVGVFAIGRFSETSKPSKKDVLNWAKSIGKNLDFFNMKTSEYLNNYRKIEWPSSSQDSVTIEKVVHIPTSKVASIAGFSYQIFEDDVIGIKRHLCKDLLMLDAMATIGRALASNLLSDSTSDVQVPHRDRSLGDTLRALGIESIDFEVIDIYENAAYFNVKAISKSSRSENVERNGLRLFMEHLGEILKSASNDELNQLLTKLNWKPDLLLFQKNSASSFDVLANYYSFQVRIKTYEFERPTECLEAFHSSSERKSDLLELWKKFFSGTSTTRSVTALLDNTVEDVASSIKDLFGKDDATDAKATIIKTLQDITWFVRTRPLLPSSSSLPSMVVHERFIRGWEGETATSMSSLVKEGTVPTPDGSATVISMFTPFMIALSCLVLH